MRGNRKSPEQTSNRGLIGKALNRVSRYSEILRILIRYGFSDLVRKVDIDFYRRLRRGDRIARRVRKSWTRPERMRRALEELGPTFVKIGQILSHRPDLLPNDWIKEFEKLRGGVRPVEAGIIREAVIQELGLPPEELFAEFNLEPIASASIAQVHRARLKNDAGEPGIEVAVKIQRPGIARIIQADLSILGDFARLAFRRIPAMVPFQPVDAVRELERALRLELDFRCEADNLETFRQNFADDQGVTAPKPYRQYSGVRILTMDFIDGTPAGDFEGLNCLDLSLSGLARRGAAAVLRQIFEHRFFHSDPHGNNILILADGTIAFLDFGQVGTIMPSQRYFLADLLAAIVRSDAVRAVRAILNWSGYQEPEVTRQLTMDMEYIIEEYLSRPFGRLDLGEMVGALFDIIRRYSITIPSNFYLLAKALATIEDIAGMLDADFDFIQASRPFVKRMIRQDFSPERLAAQATDVTGDAARFLRDFPGDARDLMNLLKAGRLRMEFELKDLDTLNSTIKRVVTRLSEAVLLAAMIMGSSLLVQSRIPPYIYGIPVIGLVGFMFSGIVGVFLLIDLWRHR